MKIEPCEKCGTKPDDYIEVVRCVDCGINVCDDCQKEWTNNSPWEHIYYRNFFYRHDTILCEKCFAASDLKK